MSNQRENAISYAHQNQERFLEELKTLVAIPSVSAESKYQNDVKKAADWLAQELVALGAKNIAVMPTALHPLVVGELFCAEPTAPTFLVYGHYDVQPPDPLDQWKTPPFEPSIRGENLYGRGASDMKGQLMAGLKAIESILKTDQFAC